MDVFGLRKRLVDEYANYTRSFITVRDGRIRDLIESELDPGLLWPEPMVQLNPSTTPWPSPPRTALRIGRCSTRRRSTSGWPTLRGRR